MDYRDGICALTREQSEGCIVLPAGVVFNNREVLLSDAGINELGEILKNPEAHWQSGKCCITGEESDCVAIWGRLAPKRSVMISKEGITQLKSAISSRPADYGTKVTEVVKESPPKPIPEPTPEAAPLSEEKESKALAEARVDREVAEMNLKEAEDALANMVEGDDEEALKSALTAMKGKVEEAKIAEEAAKG